MKEADHYVLTQDVGPLIERWCAQRGLRAPSKFFFQHFFNELARNISAVFRDSGHPVNVIRIWASDLSKLIAETVSRFQSGKTKTVSLDRIYARADFYIDVSRAEEPLSEGGWKFIGLAPRAGFPSLNEQLSSIIGQLTPANEVVLIDDGLWSGSTLSAITTALEDAGLKIRKIVVGIMVEAEDRYGLHSRVVYGKQIPSVVDWVCERDFIPGISLSGRSVGQLNGHPTPTMLSPSVGALYLPGLGDAEKWASLPSEAGREFSAFCIDEARMIFAEIARLNQRQLALGDLDRIPYGLHAMDPSLDLSKAFEHLAKAV